MPGDRCRCGHCGTDQVGAAALALATLEIAVRRRCAALAGTEAIGVHPEAHGASRLAPLEAGVAKYAIEAFFFGLGLDDARARHDEREADVRSELPPFHHRSRDAQVLYARVGAGADEYLVELDVRDARARLEPHVDERALHAL